VEYASSLIWKLNEGGFDCAGLIMQRFGLDDTAKGFEKIQKWDMQVCIGLSYAFVNANFDCAD
jgi:hypothetical protein